MVVANRLQDALTDHTRLHHGMNLNSLLAYLRLDPAQLVAGGLVRNSEIRCSVWKCIAHRINHMHNHQRRAVETRDRLSVAKCSRCRAAEVCRYQDGPEFEFVGLHLFSPISSSTMG